jgi:hypothetical protein
MKHITFESWCQNLTCPRCDKRTIVSHGGSVYVCLNYFTGVETNTAGPASLLLSGILHVLVLLFLCCFSPPGERYCYQ